MKYVTERVNKIFKMFFQNVKCLSKIFLIGSTVLESFVPGGPVGPGSPGIPNPIWPLSPFCPRYPAGGKTHKNPMSDVEYMSLYIYAVGSNCGKGESYGHVMILLQHLVLYPYFTKRQITFTHHYTV